MNALKYIAGKLFSNDKEVALVEDIPINSGIESGGTVDGYWVRYPDGTQMCSGNESVNSAVQGGYITFPLPKAFIANKWTITATPTLEVSTSSGSTNFITVKPNTTGTTITVKAKLTQLVVGSTSQIVLTTGTISYIAIGRWK